MFIGEVQLSRLADLRELGNMTYLELNDPLFSVHLIKRLHAIYIWIFGHSEITFARMSFS